MNELEGAELRQPPSGARSGGKRVDTVALWHYLQ